MHAWKSVPRLYSELPSFRFVMLGVAALQAFIEGGLCIIVIGFRRVVNDTILDVLGNARRS